MAGRKNRPGRAIMAGRAAKSPQCIADLRAFLRGCLLASLGMDQATALCAFFVERLACFLPECLPLLATLAFLAV